jgi:hypothetical protein
MHVEVAPLKRCTSACEKLFHTCAASFRKPRYYASGPKLSPDGGRRSQTVLASEMTRREVIRSI